MRSRRPADDERGSAALEFGIVAPMVLMFIFGIIQYGYLYWSLETASAGAREAARQLIVGTDEGCVTAQAAAKADVPAVGSTPPAVHVVYHDPSGAVTGGPVVGGIVTVSVSFATLDLSLPFLPMPAGGTVSQHQSGRVESIPAVPLAC
jgi:Flp pilus assembly protein TadG